jgi:hypothetical protein
MQEFKSLIHIDAFCFHNPGIRSLNMGASRSTETSVNICQITRCYIQEDSNLHSHRHENCKSRNLILSALCCSFIPSR